MTHEPMPTIAQVIRQHRSTGKSVGGLLDECSCGAAVDEYALHWQKEILVECFPHLAALHLRLILSPSTISTRPYNDVLQEMIDLGSTLDAVRDWTTHDRAFPTESAQYAAGYRAAQAELDRNLTLWKAEDAARAATRQ